jgi:hypothetical protein
MGKCPEGIAARSGNEESDRLNDCEAHNVSSSPQEDRRRSKGTLGKGKGAAEEGGVDPDSVLTSNDKRESSTLD